jgi:hypothetical protein
VEGRWRWVRFASKLHMSVDGATGMWISDRPASAAADVVERIAPSSGYSAPESSSFHVLRRVASEFGPEIAKASLKPKVHAVRGSAIFASQVQHLHLGSREFPLTPAGSAASACQWQASIMDHLVLWTMGGPTGAEGWP